MIPPGVTMQTDTVSPAEMHHVYQASYQNPSYLRSRTITWVIGFVLYFALQVPSHSWHGAFISAIIYSLVVIAFSRLANTQFPQIIVTAEAFEYATGWKHYRCYWSQVESLRRSSTLGALVWGRDGLRLPHKPYIRIGPRHFNGWRGFVPLEWFAVDWRHSPLGDDIRRYAPWLLEG